MGRYKYRIITLPRCEMEPGGYHDGDARDEQCLTATETEDGCSFCQEEMDVADEMVAKQEEQKGYEILDIMLTNDPWTSRDEGWEFWVKEKKL